MNLTPEQRADALFYYFGWQGGNVHQLASETGLTTNQILYDAPDVPKNISSDFSSGFSAVRTCTKTWRVETLAPRYIGNISYWLGVMEGYNITK